jgi:hypothetical protein
LLLNVFLSIIKIFILNEDKFRQDKLLIIFCKNHIF